MKTLIWVVVIISILIQPVKLDENADAITDNAGKFKSKNQTDPTSEPEKSITDHSENAFKPTPITPDTNQIFCQAQRPTAAEDDLERQEQEARNVEKSVVGLEIAQGALEITLGAIRIATAATTADVLRRNDNIASSKKAIGQTDTPSPIEIIAPLRDDVRNGKKKQHCTTPTTPSNTSIYQDPFSKWNQAFIYRMKRSIPFTLYNSYKILPPPLTTTLGLPVSPTTLNNINIPTSDDTDHLLHLLENLLDTNSRVLGLLGIELPPITSSGSLLLHQYKERVDRRKQQRLQYAMTGYMDEDREDTDPDMSTLDAHWFNEKIEREKPIRTFTDEITRLKRIRRLYKNLHRDI